MMLASLLCTTQLSSLDTSIPLHGGNTLQLSSTITGIWGQEDDFCYIQKLLPHFIFFQFCKQCLCICSIYLFSLCTYQHNQNIKSRLLMLQFATPLPVFVCLQYASIYNCYIWVQRVIWLLTVNKQKLNNEGWY